MNLFEVHPSDEREFDASIIIASHRWGLPGVICPVCGNTWSNTGLAYPLISLSDLPFEKDYQTPRAVPLKDFCFLRDRLLSVLPSVSLMLPGTDFGPLVGNASGNFGDFAWLNPWTPLIKCEAYLQLERAGVRLPLKANHSLVFKKGEYDTLVELQVEPFAFLRSASLATPCAACDYAPSQLPHQLVVERSTLPAHIDLFRMRNFTTLIIASENFVNATNQLGFTGIKFRKVAVSP